MLTDDLWLAPLAPSFCMTQARLPPSPLLPSPLRPLARSSAPPSSEKLSTHRTRTRWTLPSRRATRALTVSPRCVSYAAPAYEARSAGGETSINSAPLCTTTRDFQHIRLMGTQVSIYSEFKKISLKFICVSGHIEWNSQGELHATPTHFRCQNTVGKVERC